MKRALFVLAIIFSAVSYSQDLPSMQPQTSHPLVRFQYDAAGNQIIRSLCLNCPDIIAERNSLDVAEDATSFKKFFPEDVLSYYPNPVNEELNLKWELTGGNTVSSIQIYTLNGQLLKNYNNLEKVATKAVAFQEYAKGVYAVILLYSNGETKSIKIIKE